LSPVVSDIETDFKKQLQKLVPMILAPENLVLKDIGGQKVKAKELLQYFKSYLEIYKGDELPEPKSMLVVSISFLLCSNLICVCCFKLNL
jgi:atlastin